MNKKDIVNYGVAIFAMTIFALAVAPKLYAQEPLGYELQIPCAIDRTQIIIPAHIDQNHTGPYKVRCNSSAYFNPETNTYHLKKNEGYYLDLKLKLNPNEESKAINISEIKNIIINFYKEEQGNEVFCFTRTLSPSTSDSLLFHGKIGYAHENDQIEFAQQNMPGFINSCGLNTKIYFKVKITLNDGRTINGNNLGNIHYLIIDSDNSGIVAETAREKNQSQIRAKSDVQNSKPNKDTPISAEKSDEQFEARPQIEIKGAEIFVKDNKSTRKIIPVAQMLQENKIDSKKIIGDIILEAESESPNYSFKVREKKKLFGFIPIGEKIVEKRISAIKEVNE